jgi:ADP-heptose:LPS heptosyltransferase
MKTVFFHLNQLGDLLFSLPSLKAAKSQIDGHPRRQIYEYSRQPIDSQVDQPIDGQGRQQIDEQVKVVKSQIDGQPRRQIYEYSRQPTDSQADQPIDGQGCLPPIGQGKVAKSQIDGQVFSVVKPAYAPILQAAGLIDGYINKEQPLPNLIKELRQGKFDRAVLFSQSPSSLMAAFGAGIKHRAGFKTSSLSFLLNQKVEKIGVPSIDNDNRLSGAVGLKDVQKDYCGILNPPAENKRKAAQWFFENKVDPAKTIALSVGSSKKRKSKQLPKEVWIKVIDETAFEGKKEIVLSGAAYERAELLSLSAMCRRPPKVFTPNEVLDLAAFFELSRLYLGIDSGAMHLAATVGTKCIAVFTTTNPSEIGPRPLDKHIVLTAFATLSQSDPLSRQILTSLTTVISG